MTTADKNAAAILCDRLAAWWADDSAGDMPRAAARVEREALAAINAEFAADPELDDAPRATAWTRAAARLRGAK